MDEFMAHYFVLLQVKLMFFLMVVSVLGTIFDCMRGARVRKERIAVEIRKGSVPLRSQRVDDTPLLLSALNSTREPVRLVDAALRLADGSELELLDPFLSFPCILHALEGCSTTIDSTYLLRAVEYRGHDHELRVIGSVTDEVGNTYESKPFVIKPQLHLRSLGKSTETSQAAEESRSDALIHQNSALECDRQPLGVIHKLTATKWRCVFDEWIAPLVVWAVVIAMTVSAAGMLLAEG